MAAILQSRKDEGVQAVSGEFRKDLHCGWPQEDSLVAHVLRGLVVLESDEARLEVHLGPP